MKKVFFKRDNVELFLDTEAFASGGEGNLYRIRKPAKYAKFVVKLYHTDKRTQARQTKVEYMITNPPMDYVQQDHYSVIWPLGLIFERSGFAGFLMPFAKGEKLEILSMPRIRKSLMGRWGRFDFTQKEAIQLRLKICYNIAAAVYQVHETDHYVLVDLKTDNIIIQNNGLISIVDMDSVEVIENDRVLFPATVTTPEYTPPEYYTKNVQPGKQPIFESWDMFSLSIIFYKLLFGIHPYAASCNPPFDKLASLHQKIEAGLFVHAAAKRQHFKVVPPPHRKFSSVNPAIQSLFLRCFEEGHDSPESRPNADEWCWAIAPSPRLAIDRKLPSRNINIGQVTYSKPLHVATNTTQILPSIPPQNPPVVQAANIESNLVIPRAIAGGTVGLFFLWIVAFGISGSVSGLIQVATFFATSAGMLYAYFRELPENKRQQLVARKLKRLRLERTDTNKELIQMKAQIARLPNSQQQIAKNFEKKQKQRLIQEKKEIEARIRDLRLFLAEQDKKARELLMEESKMTQALQKSYFGDAYTYFKQLARMPIEEQLDWLKKERKASKRRIELKYRQKISNITQEVDKQKVAKRNALEKQYLSDIEGIEIELGKLKQRRKNEENRIKSTNVVKSSEQLRRFGIRENSKNIFTDNGPLIGVICDYLERNGIRSAADFVDVNAEGKVKKMNAQRFEKVPFMTAERGVELKKWLENLKADLGNPDELSAAEKQKLGTRFSDRRLQERLAKIKKEHLERVSELGEGDVETQKNRLTEVYEQELKKANETIEQTIQVILRNKDTYAAEKEALETKYNSIHETITKTSETYSERIKSEIEAINHRTFSGNKVMLDETIEKIKQTTSKRDLDAILNFNQKQKTLNELDKEFYQAKAESGSFKNISFEEFLKKAILFK